MSAAKICICGHQRGHHGQKWHGCYECVCERYQGDQANELDAATRLLMSAVETFRSIAALDRTSKRQQKNSEIALAWLLAHGFAAEPGGYVPGVGFEDSAPALARRQAE